MTDYISRKAAIEAMYKEAEAHPGHTFWTTQLEALRNIPAADVRPVVRGEWLDLWIEDSEITSGGYTIPQCSVCKEDSYSKTPYCPFCGVAMREES